MKKKKKELSRMENPVLERVKDLPVEDKFIEKATVKGSYIKIILLLLALFIVTGISWQFQMSTKSLFFLLFAAFGVGIFICWNPKYSPTVSPLYVVLEGMLLGQICWLEESVHPGIALKTLIITFVIAAIVAAL